MPWQAQGSARSMTELVRRQPQTALMICVSLRMIMLFEFKCLYTLLCLYTLYTIIILYNIQYIVYSI